MTAATTAQLSRAALKGYIEKHLENAARPLSLAEVFRDVYPGKPAKDCALLALRKRLQYLAAEGRLQSDGYGDGRTWSGITEAQRAEQAAQEAAQAAWAHVRQGLADERHRFWLLDEFTYPMAWGWVDVDEVCETLVNRPGKQHVVITGRRAHPALVEAADLVTEMTKIKHPMDAGQKAACSTSAK